MIRKKLSEVSASGISAYTIFYQDTKDWFSVFNEWDCGGRYDADLQLMDSLGKIFGSSVTELAGSGTVINCVLKLILLTPAAYKVPHPEPGQY